MVRSLPGRMEKFASGRDIVKLDQQTTHSCLIAEGCAARFGQTAEGLRQLSALYLPGDMGDLHSAVLPRVSAPLQAASFATIMFIPHDAIIAAASCSPALARAFWRDCVVDMQITSEWMLNNGRRDARARVAHLLCELACRTAAAGGNRDRFALDLTQTHLGDATSLTAVHVNRTLRMLREDGAIGVKGRVAHVLDWQRLTAIADFDPAYLHLAEERN